MTIIYNFIILPNFIMTTNFKNSAYSINNNNAMWMMRTFKSKVDL